MNSKQSASNVNTPCTRDDLLALRPLHSSFVGIDSDGCIFPTMEIKQKECFHGRIVSRWHLQAIERQVRETAEFVNLYSRWRGQNRFTSLIRTMDLLNKRADVRRSGVPVPNLDDLRRWVASGAPLGNPALAEAAKATGSAELASVLEWSLDVNDAIARTVRNVAPFPWVRESLDRIQKHSDAICVSQTPTEALLREWEEHGLVAYVSAIAGQELGSKAEHIALASRGRYTPERIIMIGDAPGDLAAADANGACFFPINPGHEGQSWQRFFEEAYDRFLGGSFGGVYQKELVAEFDALLPGAPGWEVCS